MSPFDLPHPRHRASSARLCSLALVFAASGLPALSAQGSSQQTIYVEPAIPNHAPITMQVIDHGKLKEYPVKVSEEGVEIEISEMGGAIIYTWNNLGETQINFPIRTELRAILEITDPALRAERLAPTIDLLLGFARIPAESTNIQQIIRSYLLGLVDSDQIDAAYQFSRKLPLNRIPAETAKAFYSVTETLFAENDSEKGLQLLNQLRAARPEEEFGSNSQSLAKSLAAKRHFEAALSLYQPLVAVAEDSERKEIASLAAYLALETGDTAQFEKFKQIADNAPEGDGQALGAQWILEGIEAYRADDIRTALKSFGHALARLPSGNHWQEVALYYNYLAYSHVNETDIAQSIFDEMQLLFPDGAYTKELQHPTN